MEPRERPGAFTPDEQLAIVLEGLRGETEVSATCRRHGLSTNCYYKWRDRVPASVEQGQGGEAAGG